MRKYNLFNTILLLMLSAVFTGCLDFGKDEETTSPTKSQVSRCHARMYLNPSIKITPVAFKFLGSGIDDAIWFKFKADVSDLHKIFDSKVVDTSRFKYGFSFIHEMKNLS